MYKYNIYKLMGMCIGNKLNTNLRINNLMDKVSEMPNEKRTAIRYFYYYY